VAEGAMTLNMKFWEELIAYFPCNLSFVSDTSRKKTSYACVMKSNNTIKEAAVLVLIIMIMK
jgi:hypothetical protein